MLKINKIIAFCAFCALLSSCGVTAENKSSATLPDYETVLTPAASQTVPQSVDFPQTTAVPDTTASLVKVRDEIFYTKTLTQSDMDYLNKLVFVGDSICYGLAAYEILPYENVLAHASVATWSIHDYNFGTEANPTDFLGALYRLQPEIIVFSMGMNDVNMLYDDSFTDNYLKILTETQYYCPNSKLVVLAITPVCSDFTPNSEIDKFNSTLEKAIANSENDWEFINATDYLKDSYNRLKSEYSGGDGIHLNPAAYSVILGNIIDNKPSPEEGEKLPTPKAPPKFIPPATAPPVQTPTTTQASAVTKPAVSTTKPSAPATKPPVRTTKPADTTKNPVSTTKPAVPSMESPSVPAEPIIVTTENESSSPETITSESVHETTFS